MPTYDYVCQACGHQFEVFQSITAGAMKKCPCCGKLRLRRLIGTGAGVIFRGDGFYQTDYRSESYRKAAEKDKPPEKAKPADKDKPADKAKPAARDKPASGATTSKAEQ